MPSTIKIYILLLICFYAVCVKAQNKQANEKKLIQFSGLVVTVANDSTELSPVPFASIKIKGSEQGTISDNAFFSFVAQAGDVIEFSALGYKTYTFKVPDTLTESKYSLIQVLSTDTIYFSETVITPWATIEQFRKSDVSATIPDNDMSRAERNLDLAAIERKSK